MYYTNKDIANLKVKIGATENVSALLKNMIETDEKSPEKAAMLAGENYYACKHDIVDRSITYYTGTTRTTDPTATNRKLPHPFHRNMVDQKVDRILGEPLTFSSDDEKALNLTLELIGKDKDKKFKAICRNASNKGVEWVHPFLDEEGNFQWAIVPAEQVIAIYDERFEEKLSQVIRYYIIREVANDGSEKKRHKVEWWDDKQVTFYREVSENLYVKDPDIPVNPMPHFWLTNTANPQAQDARSWERLPWIPFLNNSTSSGDLQTVKALIDDYDLTVSDFSNTLADIQDVIWKLKGYEGEDLKAFMADLKLFKAIKLEADPNSDAEPVTADIPTEARGSHLDRLKQDIHLFGRGVDMKASEVIGNSPSGVALKFIFAWMDLKCKDAKSNFSDGLKDLIWFAAKFAEIFNKGKVDPGKIEFTFNDSLIINEGELITNIAMSKGTVSDETLIAKHPWVTDPEEELRRVKKQKDEQQRIFLGGINDNPVDDNGNA